MKQNMFSVPIYKYKVKNWKNKKKDLINLFNYSKKEKVVNVISSENNIKSTLLNEEIQLFEQDIGKKFIITNFWFQQYYSGMDHGAHTHGPFGFSSICYIKYNKNHPSTLFYSPYTNSLTGLHDFFSPEVEEGDVIFFPSNILHSAPVNNDIDERIVLAFNLVPTSTKNNFKINY